MHGTPLFLFPPYQKPPSNALRRGAMRKKPPIAISLRQRRNAEKTAEERFHTLARGWLAYPVTPIHSHLPPKSGCRNVIPRLANNLYNRSSAVDSLIHNQPPGRQANLGLQLYNRPSAVASPIGRHPQKRPPPIGHHLQKRPLPSSTIPIGKTRPSSMVCANGAMRKKPPKSGLIC